MQQSPQPKAGFVMGSASDAPVMEAAAKVLKNFGDPYEFIVVSAHRTPIRMYEYAAGAPGGCMLTIQILAISDAARKAGLEAFKTAGRQKVAEQNSKLPQP